jgi:hypothetical protein
VLSRLLGTKEGRDLALRAKETYASRPIWANEVAIIDAWLKSRR